MEGKREIWILRHAEAEPTGPEGDASRVLTGRGRSRAGDLGRLLAKRELLPSRVVSSPYLRARETAALVAAAAAHGVEVEIDLRLEPGGDGEDLAAAALEDGALPALLVGHNPDLEDLVHALSGTPVAMRKGMLVRIAFERSRGRIVEVI